MPWGTVNLYGDSLGKKLFFLFLNKCNLCFSLSVYICINILKKMCRWRVCVHTWKVFNFLNVYWNKSWNGHIAVFIFVCFSQILNNKYIFSYFLFYFIIFFDMCSLLPPDKMTGLKGNSLWSYFEISYFLILKSHSSAFVYKKRNK